MTALLLGTVCLLCVTVVLGATRNGVTEEEELMASLKESLPKYRPPEDMALNTVLLYVDLYQILDVDEKNGVITVKLWLYTFYFSESARWNSSDYGGLDTLLVPAKTFWTPDVG